MKKFLAYLLLALVAAGWPCGAHAELKAVSNSGGLPTPVINGNCIIGSGGVPIWGSCSGSGTSVSSITGTTGQITVTPTTGTPVVSLPATITPNLTFSGNLALSGVLSGVGLSNYLASPPAIGGSSAAAGNFTTLGASSNLTTNITGSTQCVHANSSGVLSGTGSDCGSGGGSSQWITSGSNIYYVVGAVAIGTTTQTTGTALDLGSNTNSLLLPTGTTGQRPTGVAGMVRYNSSATPSIEAFVNGVWQSLGLTPNNSQGANYTVTQTDMNGQLNLTASATVTIPAISTTIFPANDGLCINNEGTGTVTISSTPTINGNAPTVLGPAGFLCLLSNGTTLDAFGFSYTNGADNQAFGSSTAIGPGTLSGQTTAAAYSNTAVGYQAMHGTMTTAALENTALGYKAASALTSATDNVAIGGEAMSLNTGRSQSVAVGYKALNANDTFGTDASTAVGYQALMNLGNGSTATAVGNNALMSLSSSVGGTCVGGGCGQNATGGANTGLGSAALEGVSSGGHNTAVGDGVISNNSSHNITGSNNTVVGANIMPVATGAVAGNSALGENALAAITTGSNNTVLGLSVGSALTTGSNNILIGNSSAVDAASATTSFELNIGNLLYGNTTGSSSQVGLAIGSSTVTTGAALDMSSQSTLALLLPSGTTGQRPTGTAGMIRYNSSTPGLEAFYNSVWNALGSGGGGSVSITAGSSNIVASPSPITGTGTVDLAAAVSATTSVTSPFFNATTAGTGYEIGGANAVSFNAGDSGTAGSSLAIGVGALSGQTVSAAYSSTAVGYQTLHGTETTAAIDNVAVGYQAGVAITTGNKNTFIGYQAGNGNTTTSTNIAIGYQSVANANGNNIAIGSPATAQNNGGGNVAIGGSATATGGAAIALGENASATGGGGMAFGSFAIASGGNSTAVGVAASAGSNSTTAGNNANKTGGTLASNATMMGFDVGEATSGTNNTLYGYQVGMTTLTTGTGNLMLGTSASVDTPAATTSNYLNINNMIVGDMSHGTLILDGPAIGTPTSCGTSPAVTTGANDMVGEITEGSVATGCFIPFSSTKTNAPVCTVAFESGLAGSYSVSTTGITITNIGSLSSTKISYMCAAASNVNKPTP